MYHGEETIRGVWESVTAGRGDSQSDTAPLVQVWHERERDLAFHLQNNNSFRIWFLKYPVWRQGPHDSVLWLLLFSSRESTYDWLDWLDPGQDRGHNLWMVDGGVEKFKLNCEETHKTCLAPTAPILLLFCRPAIVRSRRRRRLLLPSPSFDRSFDVSGFGFCTRIGAERQSLVQQWQTNRSSLLWPVLFRYLEPLRATIFCPEIGLPEEDDVQLLLLLLILHRFA